MHVLLALHAFVADNANMTNTANRELALPVLNSAMFLIPAALGVSAIHKLMEHRETALGVVIDLLVKGGAALLMIQLMRVVVNIR